MGCNCGGSKQRPRPASTPNGSAQGNSTPTPSAPIAGSDA